MNITTDFIPTNEMILAAKNYLLHEAWLNTIKPVVHEVQCKVLAELRPRNKNTNEIIAAPKEVYFMNNADFKDYLAILHGAYAMKGINIEFGHCPLSKAEHELVEAKKELVNAMEPVAKLKTIEFFTCGQKGIKLLDEFVDISLRLLAPYLKDML